MTTPCKLACGHYVCAQCLRVLKNKKAQMKKLVKMKMMDNEMAKLKVTDENGEADAGAEEDEGPKKEEEAEGEAKPQAEPKEDA